MALSEADSSSDALGQALADAAGSGDDEETPLGQAVRADREHARNRKSKHCRKRQTHQRAAHEANGDARGQEDPERFGLSVGSQGACRPPVPKGCRVLFHAP